MNESTPEGISPSQLQQLVNMAFQDGPEKAIQKARESHDLQLLDDLQRELSKPETHDELLRRGKISQAP